MAKYTFEQVTQELTSDHGLNRGQFAQYHAFNPNGAYAKQKAMDHYVDSLVDTGKVKSGWLFAYGSLAHDFTYNWMFNREGRKASLLDRATKGNRNCQWFELRQWVSTVQRDFERVQARCDELGLTGYPEW